MKITCWPELPEDVAGATTAAETATSGFCGKQGQRDLPATSVYVIMRLLHKKRLLYNLGNHKLEMVHLVNKEDRSYCAYGQHSDVL